jgi:hypothetical protein
MIGVVTVISDQRFAQSLRTGQKEKEVFVIVFLWTWLHLVTSRVISGD